MKVNLNFIENMKIEGVNSNGHKTQFDTKAKIGGDDSAATPMEIMLESLGGCSMMDVIAILRKKRKTIESFNVEIEAERAETHPMVFTKANIKYYLKSLDAELKDLQRAVELSQDSYCSVSAMFKRSGCEVTAECYLL